MGQKRNLVGLKGVIEVRLLEVPGSKATDEKFIPIVWGERVNLIQVDQIELYVKAELADRERIASGYYGSKENQSRYALARVDAKTSQPGKRFGKPIAPKAYQSLSTVLPIRVDSAAQIKEFVSTLQPT